MKRKIAIALAVIFSITFAACWFLRPLPKEHPKELLELKEFYERAAKEHPNG